MDTSTKRAGNEGSFRREHPYPPESNSTVNDIQGGTGEVAANVKEEWKATRSYLSGRFSSKDRKRRSSG